MEQARSRIRYHLGVNGKRDRKHAKHRRPARMAGESRPMPKSIAEPWQRHEMRVTGRVGIISDVHVPYHSEIAVAAAVGYLRDLGVSGILLNGDICDFYSISRWMKDPSQRDFKGELEACRDFLAYIRNEFPDVPIVMKSGNHEERFQHWLWQHAAEISDDPVMSLGSWLKLRDHDITLVEDQRPVMLGKLPVLHGHELPRGMAAPVNVARGAFLRTLSTCLVGHSHRTSNHTESDMWHAETACWSAGCLCDLTPEYARINRWNWGFAIATIHDDGQFDVENLRITLDGVVRTS
jgi:predicted phosphodiesterase